MCMQKPSWLVAKSYSYKTHFWDMNKDTAENLMQKSELNEKSKYVNCW